MNNVCVPQILIAAVFSLVSPLPAETNAAGNTSSVPADSRFEIVPVVVQGQNGLKVDKYRGETFYLEDINGDGKWVRIKGPEGAAGATDRVNFQVSAGGSNVFLLNLTSGDTYRLAADRGGVHWKKVN